MQTRWLNQRETDEMIAAWRREMFEGPLRPKVPQKPCDVGLFSDEADQLDLCEMFQDSTEED